MIVYGSGYVTKMVGEFQARKTTFFSHDGRTRDLPLETLLEQRIGPIQKQGKAYSQVEYANSAVDFVITDTPQEVYGYIKRHRIVSLFKLPDVQAQSNLLLGKGVASWEEVFALPPVERGKLLTPLVAAICQKNRKTEAAFFNYQQISWEEYGRYWTAVEIKEEGFAIFPQTRVSSYALMPAHHWNAAPECFVIYGDHLGDGSEMCWVTPRLTKKGGLLASSDFKRDLFPSSDVEAIVKAIQEAIPSGTPTIFASRPEYPLSLEPTTSVRVFPPAFQVPDLFVDLPGLTQIARDLGVKGYSTKTKAELSIMVNEAILSLESPKLPSAMLHIGQATHHYGYGVDTEQNLKTHILSPLERYCFQSRVISNRAFVASAAPSPAGRVPTDGKFDACFGLEPLSILEESTST